MVARTAAASNCRRKCKKPEKPILVGEPKESLSPLCATVQIRKFLGATGFCGIWIPTKGGEWKPMVWGEEQEKAFKEIKRHSQMPLLWACQM
jgi:hypothetical protein